MKFIIQYFRDWKTFFKKGMSNQEQIARNFRLIIGNLIIIGFNLIVLMILIIFKN